MKVYPIFDTKKQNAIANYFKRNNERNYLLYLTGTHTGLRVSDIVTLKAKDFTGGILTVREKKTGKVKSIAISKVLKFAMNDYIKANNIDDNSYIFTSRQSSNSHISIRRVQQIMKSLSRILNINENINSHSLRKTFAYNLYQKSNHNIALVMQALNHTKEAITLKYICISEKLLNDLILDL